LLEIDRRAERSSLAEAEFVSGARTGDLREPAFVLSRRPAIYPRSFNSRQLILAGSLDQNELIRRIAARAFAVVQLRADICDDPEAVSCHILHHRRKFNRFTDDVLYAIDRYYRIAWRSQDGTFYVPK